MPDIRAMHAIGARRAGLRDQINTLLYRYGYDAKKLDALPDPGECPPELAQAILAWREVNDALDQAEARTSGRRY
jgi:hypothetical protein